MITFNNIVERFEIFAENHFFIKSFSFGSPDDVDLSKFEEFPLMHLVYTGATYDAGMKTYNLEVYILDVPHDKTGKVIPQKEAISDSEQCAEDILADIKMGGNIFLFAQDYEVVNATTTPLEEETKNVLSGVLLDLSVAIPYEWDACNAPIDGVEPGGTDVIYARRGILRMLTLDGATDVQSVRTIKVTNGTLTDDGDGVVTLDTGGVETLEELTDVNIIGTPDQGDVISYNTGTSEWMRNGGLQELLARFKASGTGAQMYDTLNDTTKGYVDILANSATMKVNNSGLTITEASPGVLSLSVAAGTDGNEVEFEAFVITGSDTLTTAADVVFKYGSKTYWEVAGGKKIFLRALNTEDITVVLPSTGGQLALTTDIPSVPVDSVNGQTGVVVLDTGDIDENGNLYYTEARVAANSAVVANTAKVSNVQSDWNASSGLAVILNKPTIPTQGLLAVVDDTSPQLGGNLDVNGFTITSTANADIDIEPNGTGDINLKADTLNLTDNSNSARFEIAAGYVRLISTTVGTIWQANTGSNRFDVKQPLALGDASPTSTQKLAIRTGNNGTYIVFESAGNVEVGNFKNDASGNISFTLDGDITTTETLDAVNLTINGAQGTDGQVLTSTGTGVGWEDSGGGGGGVTAVTGTAPIVSSGGTTPAVSITAATTSAAGSMSAADKTKLNDITTPYEEDEIFAGQNITMNTGVSVTSNRIADIMGDALADASNANSKKFLGYHTGSGVCVLQGMVDAGASISGATNGGPLWIGASGAFSATAPTTTNYYSRVVGYYVGNGVGGEEIVYFDPSKDWVQIS
jgi:hypothetical protein